MHVLTHCKYDHEFTEENTYLSSNGRRHCKECRRLRMQRRREGTHKGQANSKKTQCAKGHPYDDENTLWFTKKNGAKRRNCRACTKAHQSRLRILKYGITEAQYADLLIAQHNQCKICSKKFDKTPHIDHDHITGLVRGLLCYPCNSGIGQFQDSPELLQNAIDYLAQFSKTTTE